MGQAACLWHYAGVVNRLLLLYLHSLLHEERLLLQPLLVVQLSLIQLQSIHSGKARRHPLAWPNASAQYRI